MQGTALQQNMVTEKNDAYVMYVPFMTYVCIIIRRECAWCNNISISMRGIKTSVLLSQRKTMLP